MPITSHIPLALCPLCSGQAQRVKHSAGMPGTMGHDTWHAVACKTCGITMGASNRRFRDPDDAAKAWNARKPLEPMTRFCPGCGSVGEVPAKSRDCCPDGSQARVIPAALAQQCHAYIRALEDAESSLSEEVLREGANARHWQCVASTTREALHEAQAYIQSLEQDREIDRIAAYKRALANCGAHNAADEEEQPPVSAMPALDPSGPNMRTAWFRSRRDAQAYADNAGFSQEPERRRVWLDLAWREEWSLRVPTEQEEKTA